ncbi:MAG: glycosyltransferase family 4 protein [Candidatus Eisenbacteria bacterium]|nr:glycosyltransferase family 4 protein [Candidatus Eisenbacteria bacterium]
MGNKLNILLLSRYFPPEIGTSANLFFELARGLTSNGHNVTVVTSFPWYNLASIPDKYRGKLYMREDLDGVEVIRLVFPLVGPRNLKLAMGHLTVPLTTFVGGLIAAKPDIVCVYSPPLFMGISAWLLKIFRKTPFIFNVQDLHPQCYIDQGILKNRLGIRILESMERLCYRKAALITVHSSGNKAHIVHAKGIDEKKVKVLHNWIDTDEMKPLPKDNEFQKRYGLDGKFVVGYAGTLGMSQGALTVIEAANILRGRKDIEFFIVGDGIEKQKMEDRVSELGLKNVRFLGMQPKSVYPYVVASWDVGLVTLNSKVKTPVVPSKILGIMAAARPVLASVPLDGDAPKLIEKAGCGICVEPENPEELAGKIVFLAENRDACERFGRNGREYAVKNLSLKTIVKDFENTIDSVLVQR